MFGKRCCRARIDCQHCEAKSGRAANDLTAQQYEAKFREEIWTTAPFPPGPQFEFYENSANGPETRAGMAHSSQVFGLPFQPQAPNIAGACP